MLPEEAGMGERLAAGTVVIVNGLRAYLPEARERFPGLIPVLAHVNREVLRQRLVSRKREAPEEIEGRLRCALPPFPDGRDVVLIDNSGKLEDAASIFRSLVRALREERPGPA